MREVTEQDLRHPDFREGAASDYEFRSDGKIVRKDRFMRGMQEIAAMLFGGRNGYEIPEVIVAVRDLLPPWEEGEDEGIEAAFERANPKKGDQL